MSTIVSIDAARAKVLEAKWAAYMKARERAEKSRDIRDGIAAGEAWSAWLELFQRGERR